MFLGGGYLFFVLQFIVTLNVCGDMCLVVVFSAVFRFISSFAIITLR